MSHFLCGNIGEHLPKINYPFKIFLSNVAYLEFILCEVNSPQKIYISLGSMKLIIGIL